MNEDVEGVTYSKYKAQSHKVEDEFLFGVSLHLGQASNNYAEYVGLIMA
jgi:hypothetical protein